MARQAKFSAGAPLPMTPRAGFALRSPDRACTQLGMDVHALIERVGGGERPLVSVIAAIAAGILAIRNPALVGVILTAFIDRKNQNEGKR